MREQLGCCLHLLEQIAVNERDPDCLILLDCCRRDLVTPEEVMTETGWSLSRYKRARRHLDRYARRLPDDLAGPASTKI